MTITVIPETARWTLTYSNHKAYSGVGSTTQNNIPCGQVKVTWAALSGYTTPNPMMTTSSLAENAPVTFCQVYVPQNAGAPQVQARLMRYLLGLPESASGLDLNNDSKISAADLVRSVILQPPGTPASPAPAEAATDVSTKPTLDWADCAHADSYSLYLWKSGQSRPAKPTVATLTRSSYQPARLGGSAVYRWLVVARNGDLATTGPIWAFTTGK